MAIDFDALRRLYDNNRFIELLTDPDGVYWLKLRSVSRAAQLRELCQKVKINCIHNFPYDLKVTYFPDGYLGELRRNAGLRPEFTELKAFCRQHGIWFEQNTPKNILFSELLAKISEHPSQSAKDFMVQFKATRANFIQRTIQDPTLLKIWLYENQEIRRFDAANRFFLVLVDKDNLEESWKLKRNKVLLTDKINTYLDASNPQSVDELKIEFRWQNEIYTTYTDILFVVVE